MKKLKRLGSTVLIAGALGFYAECSVAETLIFKEGQRILTRGQVKEALAAVEKHTHEGISAARSNDVDVVATHVKTARDLLKLVVGDFYGARIQKISAQLRIADQKIRKNDIEEALARLKKASLAIDWAKRAKLEEPKDKRF